MLWAEDKETDRSDSFCTIAVDLSEPLIVPDASLDPRFKENKLVKMILISGFMQGIP